MSEHLVLKFPMSKSGITPSLTVALVLSALSGRGSEQYSSKDKAVLFFEVPDLRAAIASIGQDRLVQFESRWAVIRSRRSQRTACSEIRPNNAGSRIDREGDNV